MSTDKVLVAEIPKAGKTKERWSQGNYTKSIMRDFFEIDPRPGTTQRKTFDWIAQDGSLHREVRPFGFRKSKNYGFELGPAVGLPYPKGTNRPIAVFRKMSGGTFRGQLLMPNHPDYGAVNKYLQANYRGSQHHRSRIITTVGALKAVWPGSPLWDD